MDAKEVKIPVALLAAAVLIYLLYGMWGGTEGVAWALQVLLGTAIIGVPLGIVACFIVAKLLDIGFGDVRTASLKLAAIFCFPRRWRCSCPTGWGGWCRWGCIWCC